MQRVSKNTIDNDITHSRSPSPGIKDTINYKLPDYLIHPLAVSIGRDNSSYHIKKDSEEKYVAITNRHKFITAFTNSGIDIRPHAQGTSSWHFGMALSGIGYGKKINPVSGAKISVSDNRIEFRRDKITEWYVNSPLGLEQGFTLISPPLNKSLGENLVLELDVSGDLYPKMNKDHKDIVLMNENGNDVLNYGKLYVYDSKGEELPSYMALTDNKIVIKVDDTSASYPVTIDPIVEVIKRTASDGSILDQFGFSVSIDMDRVVVGAPNHETTTGMMVDTGSVYILERNLDGPHMWGEIKELEATDECDVSGFSVAISGDTVAVGVPTINLEADPCPSAQPGSVRVFEKDQPSSDNWGQVAVLTASDASNGDSFGFSVGMSGDTIIVGAPGDDCASGDDCGSAYVFEKGAGWSNSTEDAKLTADVAVLEDLFGYSVSISDSEDTIVAGALFASTGGVAYVFEEPMGGWSNSTEDAILTADDAAVDDLFGFDVDINGDVVVGAPGDDDNGIDSGSAYIFDDPVGSWMDKIQDTKLTASDGDAGHVFGSSVSISGETVVVGAPGDDVGGVTAGAAYVFSKDVTGIWGVEVVPGTSTENEILTASDADMGDIGLRGVYGVNPATGDRSVVSGGGVGIGTDFINPEGIANVDSNYVIVVDKGDTTISIGQAIVLVNKNTGNRTDLSNNSSSCSHPLGDDCSLSQPIDIAVESSGHYVVTDNSVGSVHRVNKLTGHRDVLSYCDISSDVECFLSPIGIGVKPDGGGDVIVVTDPLYFDIVAFSIFPALVSVDPISGARAVVHDFSTCDGNTYTSPLGVAWAPNIGTAGEFVVVVLDIPAAAILDRAVVSVDPITGVCSIISDSTHGSGSNLDFPEGVAIDSDGGIFVVDNGLKAVVEIDPATGDRTIVSDDTNGFGPKFNNPFWIAEGSLFVTDQGGGGDEFGYSVSIDGDTAIIGARGDEELTGAAYLYQLLVIINSDVSFVPDTGSATVTSPTSQVCIDGGYPSEFHLPVTLTNNTDDKSFLDILTNIVDITNNNIVANALVPGGPGSSVAVPLNDNYTDGILSPDEFVSFTYDICLSNTDPFQFFVDVLSIISLNAVNSLQQLIETINNLSNNSDASVTTFVRTSVTTFARTNDFASSLTRPLEQAVDILTDRTANNDKAACGKINNFQILLKQSERDGELSTGQADEFTDSADNIIGLIDCK